MTEPNSTTTEDDAISALQKLGTGTTSEVDHADSVVTHVLSEDPAIEDRSGRVLVVDRDMVLLSVLADDELPGLNREAAIWSSGTGFALVFIGLLDGWFDQYIDG